MGKRKLRKEVYYVLFTVVLVVPIIIIAVNTKPKAQTSESKPKNIVSAVNKTIQTQGDSSFSNMSSATSATSLLNKTIIIDPGHGGPDPGAIGIGGVQEKNLNLAIADKLKAELTKNGFTVIMTRDSDISIYDAGCTTLAQKKDSDLNNRIKIIQANPQAVFVSIHQNFNSDPKYSGTQVYYSLNKLGSKTLANLIQTDIISGLEPDNNRKIQQPGKLRVLLKATIPAVLIECGFISNNAEAVSLESSSYQDKLVNLIAKGIVDFSLQSS